MTRGAEQEAVQLQPPQVASLSNRVFDICGVKKPGGEVSATKDLGCAD